MKNVFEGTTDEFYARLQEFVSILNAEGTDVFTKERLRSMGGGGGGYFSVILNGRMFFSIRTVESDFANVVSYTIDVENHTLEDHANEIFAQLVVYMQPIEMQPIPMAETKESALKKVAHEADIAFNTVNDNWWRYILVFQNDWNQSHPRDRITNRLVADAAYVTEGTVKNKRTKLGFSTEIDTRTDLDNDAK